MILIPLLLLSASTSTHHIQSQDQFPDVPENHWAFESLAKGPRQHIRFDDGWRFMLDPNPTIGGKQVERWGWTAAPGVQALNLDRIPDDLQNVSWRTYRVGRDVFRNRPGFAWFTADLGSSLPMPPGGKRVIHFDSVDDNCIVWVNGQKLKTHYVWNDPFDVPLEGVWREGIKNTAILLVENTGGGGGIMGPVSLRADKDETVPKQAQERFDDAGWRVVHLPHDYLLESPFTPTADASHGSLTQNPAWYRKSFVVPASWRYKSVWIQFDGVYRNSIIWLNGHKLGFHSSGYIGFRHDIAPYLHFGGLNKLAVHVDPRQSEGWWYEGAGIYRHVWLNVADPVHIAPNGVFVQSDMSPGSAKLQIQATVSNDTAREQSCRIRAVVMDPNGTPVSAVTRVAYIGAYRSHVFSSPSEVIAPKLWSIEQPRLYTLDTYLVRNGEITDDVQTSFGLRTIRFDAATGFYLNGKHVELKGTCNHQDFAGVGTGMPDSVMYWRIKKLKEMGSNAYRCSHNPPAPELLDACDRLGMVVMDENRHLGNATGPKTPKGTSIADFPELREMILRDRNHPSIVMWSMCNEEPLQGTSEGARIFSAMMKEVHRWDTSRPITCAMNGSWGEGISNVEDLQGGNYDPRGYDRYHVQFPNKPFFGSETASAVGTRGEYTTDRSKGYVSAYDVNAPAWAQPAEVAWKAIVDRPYVAGGFVWTGFDYKGEPTPYGWPCINSHFGIMDECGFPKDSYYYYKAWWGDSPVVHVYPDWNRAGKEEHRIDVWVQSNCDEVELVLSGKSLGKKPVPPHWHVAWNVNYEPGTLVAKGYIGGRVATSDEVSTTGAPAAIVLKTDRKTLSADNEDVTMVEVSVVDSQGRVVPDSNNMIDFSVTGNGTIAGVGNGDPSSHEPDQAPHRSAFHGLCMVLVRAGGHAGPIRLTAHSSGLRGADLNFRSTPSEVK